MRKCFDWILELMENNIPQENREEEMTYTRPTQITTLLFGDDGNAAT